MEMIADRLIFELLEAAEVGDDGVYLKRKKEPHVFDDYSKHFFKIFHPVHGEIGELSGKHYPEENRFDVVYVSLKKHPKYKDYNWNISAPDKGYTPQSRTLIRAGLKSLMSQIKGLRKITGELRMTGTHSRATKGYNTSVKIPSVYASK
jgi:hypothetical protein